MPTYHVSQRTQPSARQVSDEDIEEQYHTACERAMISCQLKPHLQELYPYLKELNMVDVKTHRIRCTATSNVEHETTEMCEKQVAPIMARLGFDVLLQCREKVKRGRWSDGVRELLQLGSKSFLCQEHDKVERACQRMYERLERVFVEEFALQQDEDEGGHEMEWEAN